MATGDITYKDILYSGTTIRGVSGSGSTGYPITASIAASASISEVDASMTEVDTSSITNGNSVKANSNFCFVVNSTTLYSLSSDAGTIIDSKTMSTSGIFIYDITSDDFILVRDGTSIVTYSIDGSGNMTLTSTLSLGYTPGPGCCYGSYLYISTGTYVYVYSVSASGVVTLLKQNTGFTTTSYLTADSRFLYLTYSSTLSTYSLSDTSGNITLIDSIAIGGSARWSYSIGNIVVQIVGNMTESGNGIRTYYVDDLGNLSLCDSYVIDSTYGVNYIWGFNDIVIVGGTQGLWSFKIELDSATSFYINDSGTWKKPVSVYVNVAGTWKQVQEAFINQSGTWKKV